MPTPQIIARSLATFALLFASVTAMQAQLDTLCNFTGEQHLTCPSDVLMEAIRAYEDTLSELTESTVYENYTLRRQTGNQTWYEYNCDSLEAAIFDLIAQIEAARVPPSPPGSFDPCSNFLEVSYYGATIRCMGEATGEREFLDNCWFEVNLRTAQFANGDSIDEASSAEDWQLATAPARALYRDSLDVLEDFGFHYNPAAILDGRKLCPPGWTLPDSVQLTNLQTWGSENDQLNSAQRRAEDGTWAPFVPVYVDDEYVDLPQTQFYALAFSGDAVADSLAYFANNSEFHSNNPFASRYVGADENHGMSVRCRRMVGGEIENAPDYLEWAQTTQGQTVNSPAYYYAQMPQVHTLPAEEGAMRANPFFSGARGIEAAGFKWGTEANLANADSITAEINETQPLDVEGLDSIFVYAPEDLTIGQTYYYTAWVENNFGFSFGDTLQFTYTSPFACGDESVTFDGYDYATVQIGEQCWFSENLRSTNFANEESIPLGYNDDETDWSALTTAAQTRYGAPDDSEEAMAGLEAYGRLYNWYAVADERGLCPTGWHVPTADEWIELTDFLGGADQPSTVTAMKSGEFQISGTDFDFGWDGTNSSGFTGLPGGVNLTGIDGSEGETGFLGQGFVGFWYSASLEDDKPVVMGIVGVGGESQLTISPEGSYKTSALSVRCIEGTPSN